MAGTWDPEKDNAAATVPRIRRRGDHAAADARPHLLAGRHDAEARNRRGAADADCSGSARRRRVVDERDRSGADVAGRVGCRVGQAAAEPRPRVRRARRRHAPAAISKSSRRTCRPGYLRKNGVPYSENARVTEYYNRHDESERRSRWFTVTTVVEDPKYLAQPFITSSSFKKEADESKWKPTPCASRRRRRPRHSMPARRRSATLNRIED